MTTNDGNDVRTANGCSGKRFALGLLAILALAAGVRLYGLGAESVWLDECRSIRNARHGIAYTIRHRATTLHPPLYEILLGGWVRLAGTSEAAARFPSVVFGTAAVWLIVLLGRRLGGSRMGLMAGLLAALAYFPIWYSQEARMYALLLALVAASYLLLVRALADGGRANWVGLALVNAAMAYTHTYGGLIIVVENLYFVYHWLRRRRDLRPWLGVQIATALAFAPWAWIIVRQAIRAQDNRISIIHPRSLADVWHTLTRFLPLHAEQDGGEVLFVVYALAALAGLWFVRRPAPEASDGERRPAAGGVDPSVLLGTWLLMPFAITLLVQETIGPCYQERCLLVAAPAMLLLLAATLARVRGRAGIAVAIVVFALGALGVREYFQASRKQEWRQMGSYVAEHSRPGDCVVICPHYSDLPFNYYCTVPEADLPRHTIDIPLQDDVWQPKLRELGRSHKRIWLLVSHHRALPVRLFLKAAPWAQRAGKVPDTDRIEGFLYDMVPDATSKPEEPEDG